MSAAEDLDWFHSVPIKGNLTDGKVPLKYQKRKAACIPNDLSGKRVLDVGTRDGYFAFLAEQRGAKEVIAVDKVEQRDTFTHAKQSLNSAVQYQHGDIQNIDFDYGFNLVICYGVIYHVKSPEQLVGKLCDLASEVLCLESTVIPSIRRKDAIFDSNSNQNQPIWPGRILSLYREWHESYPTANWLLSRVQEEGMDIEHTESFIPFSHTNVVSFLDQVPRPHQFYPGDSRFALHARYPSTR